MTEQTGFSTKLAKVTNIYAPMIEKQLTGNGVNMDGYARQCVVNAISAINAAMDTKGINWDDPQLDKNNLTQTLLHVAALKLNAAASPREVYFQIRNVKTERWEDGKPIEEWHKQIEMGIEGDGNDAILRRFGAGIEKVGQYWLVRQDDEFTYPEYDGFEVKPPRWVPKGKGDVIRVVYPILKKDGTPEYYIAERDDVARNLVAHINNNLMNETFGICKDRRKATFDEKKQISERKRAVLERASELGLNALDDPELQEWISPAWTEYQSREQMLIRKMRNNVVKKIPKDFGNAFIELVHSEETDSEYAHVRREIAENANGEVIDIDATLDDGYESDDAAESEQPSENVQEPQEPEPSKEEKQPEKQPVASGSGKAPF